MVKVKIKPERENFKHPIKGTDKAACFDVWASKIEFNETLDKATIYLGFSLEIEEGWKAIIIPRSSQTKSYWVVLNSPGIIDEDYRGEVQLRMTCLVENKFKNNSIFIDPRTEFPFKIGERVGQMYFEKVKEVEWELVTETSETKRGNGGFGHTGKIK